MIFKTLKELRDDAYKSFDYDFCEEHFKSIKEVCKHFNVKILDNGELEIK